MINRTILLKVIRSIQTRPVTLITGARQVGKSTLCREIMKQMTFNYVTLDDLRERDMAEKDPEMFLSVHSWPLIIDEVQYAPGLFKVIEAIVNREKFEGRNNYGMFILTGSQTYQLMEGVSESMAGRVSILSMSPLSMSEINDVPEEPFTVDVQKAAARIVSYQISVTSMYEHIIHGFCPELYNNPELDPDLFYSDYVQTYIERDVSKLIHLTSNFKFQNFMETLASLTGEELVYTTLAKAVGVDVKTIQSWVSVLAAGNIIRLLQPYNEQPVVKRIVKRPKIYFNDTGLAAWLARLNDPKTLRVSVFSGRFVETYIVNEIIKSHTNNTSSAQFYYYRDSNQNEIDLIMVDKGTYHMIECKSGVAYHESDIKGFAQMNNTGFVRGESCIICSTSKIYPIADDVAALPLSAI